MSRLWNGLTLDEVRRLHNYIDELTPYLMESITPGSRDDDPIVWDEVSNALKGHLRTSMLMCVKDTVEKLGALPSLQGKIGRS